MYLCTNKLLNYKSMKKIISLVLFLTVSMGMYAQKSYVTVYGNLSANSVSLSGDIPTSIKNKYTSDDFPELHLSSPYLYQYIGNVLNLLAKEGFIVEQMEASTKNLSTGSSDTMINYLLSKSSDNSNTNNVRMAKVVDDDSDVYEVARYNLQGMPVNENEKGFQIIVYSNFTTKTIIKE